jgi:lysophospholipase L1-like esterase
MRRRLGVRRLARIAILAATAIAVAEFALRLVFGLGDPLLFVPDPQIGYLPKASQQTWRLGNRIYINRFHQRNGEIPQHPVDAVPRIMILGDSVTWGAEMDQAETFPSRLQTLLKERGNTVQVLNASASSWGIENEIAYLERFGTFRSHTLIWQIGSHDLIQPKSTAEAIRHREAKPWTAIGELAGQYFWPRIVNGLRAGDKPITTSNAMRRQFQSNMDCIALASAITRQHGATLLILHTPNREEVVVSADESLSGHLSAFRSEFLTTCALHGIPVIDLSSEWREKPDSNKYFLDHVHLSGAGNLAVAERVATWLVKEDSDHVGLDRSTNHHDNAGEGIVIPVCQAAANPSHQ